MIHDVKPSTMAKSWLSLSMSVRLPVRLCMCMYVCMHVRLYISVQHPAHLFASLMQNKHDDA